MDHDQGVDVTLPPSISYCTVLMLFSCSYYFRGDTASYKEYINPAHFHSLAETIDLVRSTITGSKYPKLAIWNGESSDAWHSGTANISDRFISGFL